MTEFEITCCFTGHRDIPRNMYPEISNLILCEINSLYEKGVRRFITGGAIGFDMIAAVTVINFRNVHPDVTLELALPCPNHDAKWSTADRALLTTVRSRSDKESYISKTYDKGCMYKRNRYMVEKSAYLISYCHKKSGGSYYTECYAEKLGRRVINIL